MKKIPYLRISISDYKILKLSTLYLQFEVTLISWKKNSTLIEYSSIYSDKILNYHDNYCLDNFTFQKAKYNVYNNYSSIISSLKLGKITFSKYLIEIFDLLNVVSPIKING